MVGARAWEAAFRGGYRVVWRYMGYIGFRLFGFPTLGVPF